MGSYARVPCGNWVALVGVIALCCVAEPARADNDALIRARVAVEKLDYMHARTLLAEALAAGNNSPDELAEIYKLTGLVTSTLGDSSEATDAFQRLLALVPTAEVPVGSSPKIKRPFSSARDYYQLHAPLKVEHETSVKPPAITIRVISDPMAMLARVRVITIVDGEPSQTREEPAAKELTLPLPEAKRLELRVELVDERGNRVVEIGSELDPIVMATAPPPPPPVVVPPPPPPEPLPIYRQWWLWGGVAAVVAGGATYFGISVHSKGDELSALHDDSTNHRFSEAHALEDRMRRDALIANIGFAAAGALAVTSAVMWWTSPRDTSQESTHTTVTAAPTPGGASLWLEVGF